MENSKMENTQTEQVQPNKEFDFGPADVGRERIWSMSDEEYYRLHPSEKEDKK